MQKLFNFVKTTVTGGLVVMVPMAIRAYAVGQMIVVPAGSTRKIDASLTDMLTAVSQMGIEANRLYDKASRP